LSDFFKICHYTPLALSAIFFTTIRQAATNTQSKESKFHAHETFADKKTAKRL